MAILQDFRLAARTLARNKGWTAVAALALALGLGSNVAIFSVVGLMVWTPVPYPHPEQLAYVTQTNAAKGFKQASVSLRDTRDWAAASSIASIAAYLGRPLALSGQGEPQHLPAMQVTPEFFPILGVVPALGRAFTPREGPETESRVAIISYELWQGMFRGDPAVLAREIRLDGRNYSIVGVMPEGFQFLYQRKDVWVPLSLEPARRERAWRGLSTVARLAPGASVSQASAEVRAISQRIEQEDPASGLDWRGAVRPIADRIVDRNARKAGGTMFAAVGFVLLIACANVASLLLARGALRRRELALRAALGAGRAALIRLQLAESVLLSVVGGTVGVLSAIWSIPLLKRVAPSEMTIFQTARLDWNALAFGFALSLLTGILFGVVPAWMHARGDLALALQDSARGSSTSRHTLLRTLVAAEMALALVLLAASTLMIRSLIRQTTMDPGFDRNNLYGASILLSSARYPEKSRIVDFYSRSLENLRRDGNVESAALVETIPLGGDNSYTGVHVEGDSDSGRDPTAGIMIVSPGYFRTMRIPLLAGRDFGDADNAAAAPVAIVNQAFVRRFWPKESTPVGRRLRLGPPGAPWIPVVGLARDVHHTSLSDPPRPELYRPHAQAGERIMMLVARGRTAAQTPAAAIRSAVWQVDREQPLFRLQSVDAMFANRASGERATAKVLGFLAFVALVLAAVGTYGVMAYTAAQRVREIGIRLALGAGRRDVFRMVLRAGLLPALAGLAIGLPAACGVAPLLRAFTNALDARDTAAYAGVALLLLCVALGACLVPAVRSMRVDPARVLRNE